MFEAGFKKFTKFIKQSVDKGIKNLSHEEEPVLTISDIRTQKRNYDCLIPIVYGEILLAGNIIWTSKLTLKPYRENRDPNDFFNIPILDKFGIGGGFFGNGGEEEEIHYFVDIAIGIAEGKVDELIALYINGTPVDLASLQLTFYKGEEKEIPSPVITRHEGSEKTPAFRGLCYVVIENFNITPYGNILPKFEFLIRRTNFGKTNGLVSMVKQSIKGINLLPGTGEFAYDTSPVTTYGGFFYNDQDILDGKIKHSNTNTFNKNKSDAIIALDLMKEDLPSLEWVSVVITWFTNTVDISEGIIYPAVEFNDRKSASKPHKWSCAGKNRWETRKISNRKDGSSNYGGTVCDSSLVRLLEELRVRGYKICLYPMIFVDTQEKPWRGRITGNAENIPEYFQRSEGYNNFILHYARLSKGLVDAFIIGSEMKGLTGIRDKNGNYPAVLEFEALAHKVKKETGHSTKITYAADWSEYHSTEGFYNMDALWASNAIDFIGIDAYFPLTEGPEKKQFLEIKNGWIAGEGYDYYYKEREKIYYQNPSFAWKNIRWFMENTHINIDGSPTLWKPNSKKIWFTEYGFPSVELCTNQPNVFFDPTSNEGGFPKYSSGNSDFTGQKLALLSAVEFIEENSDIIENGLCWCYDLRPYPFFPMRGDIWKDNILWKTGHWLNGKMGANTFNEIVFELSVKSGLLEEEIEFHEAEEVIEGFCISREAPAYTYIDTLCEIFGVKSATSANGISFKSLEFLNNAKTIKIEEENSLLKKNKNTSFILEENEIKNSFPKEAVISFIDKNSRNEISSFSYKPEGMLRGTIPRIKVNLPLVFSKERIALLTRQLMCRKYLERTIKRITLPARYIFLQAGDVLETSKGEKIYINHISLNDSMEIITEGFSLPTPLFREKEAHAIDDPFKHPVLPLPSQFMVFSLPDFFEGEKGENFYMFALNLPPQTRTFYISLTLQAKIPLGKLSSKGVRGKIILGKLTERYDNAFIDNISYIEVFLENEAKIERLFENFAIIGEEVCFFETALEREKGRYAITSFIRKGIFLEGMEADDFILLSAVEKISLPSHIWDGGSFALETGQKAIFYKAEYKDMKTGNIFQIPEKEGILFYWQFIKQGDSRKFEDFPLIKVEINFTDMGKTLISEGESFFFSNKKQIEIFGFTANYFNVAITFV